MSKKLKHLHIKRLILRGFKSIEQVDIEINSSLNILIGKNGSGKSNFFDFIREACKSFYASDTINFKSADIVLTDDEDDNFLFKVSRNLFKFKIDADELDFPVSNKALYYQDELLYDAQDDEKRIFNFKGKKVKSSKNLHLLLSRLGYRFRPPYHIGFAIPKNIEGLTEPYSLEIPFNDWDFFTHSTHNNIFSSAIGLFDMYLYRRYSELVDEADLVDEDGELEIAIWKKVVDEVSIDSFLAKSQIDDAVLHDLKKFTPIEDVRINKSIVIFRTDSKLIIDNIKLEFLVNGDWIPWNYLSDGSRRMLYLVSQVSGINSPTVLVEEPELGIHPHQFELILEFLKEKSLSSQVIISTHSPKALDILLPEELDKVLIAEYIRGAGTKISRMSEQQKNKAKKYIKSVGFLSDYWIMSDLEP